MSSTPYPVTAFDEIAEGYDRLFSFSPIGVAQRRAVWDQARKTFRAGDHILELNCGTGEDACYLASLGVDVLGLDSSPKMIEVARRKSQSVSKPPSFEVLAIERLAELPTDEPFDGVFSNFSGLNCVQDLHAVAETLSTRTRPGCPALLCFSTRICLWEIAWYAAHIDLRRALRRLNPAGCDASIGEVKVRVFYPPVSVIRRAFEPWFRLMALQAVGLTVPPSYLNHKAVDHPRLLKAAEHFDRVFSRLPIISRLGDHVLMTLERERG